MSYSPGINLTKLMFVQLPVINIQYWRDETIWRWGNEESSEDEVELVENVEIINNKVAQESINTVLRYLYQQKPDFGKVDEEVSPEKLK